jgi:hypothetical protein
MIEYLQAFFIGGFITRWYTWLFYILVYGYGFDESLQVWRDSTMIFLADIIFLMGFIWGMACLI